MDEEQNKEEQKKIGLPEAIILTMYIGFTDLIGIVLVIFGLDDFFIIDILTFPVTQFYFRMKGVKGIYDLVGNIAEIIPYVGAFPIRIVGLIITIYIANHPKIAQVAQGATGKFGTAAAAGKTAGAAGAVK